jgi:hypothetical protein
MYARFHQILLILSISWLSWLTMMLVHEGGHVLGAWCTGGSVQRVVWHPTVISRTDVSPNPHPLIEIWAGPLVGSIVPMAAAAAASLARLRWAYLVWFLAGFCMIANGAYIGLGSIWPTGDAKELIAHGTPRWWMALFGLLALPAGFWIWHRISPRLGFGVSPGRIEPTHSLGAVSVAVVITIIGMVLGNPGI